jgi:dTDP-4-dehydrorhamnose reductase
MSTKHFLILGSSGMLGRAWRELLSRRNIPFTHGDHDRFDITNPTSVAKGIAIGPATHVINCAAWTDVDGAETNEAGATRINGDAVRVLADACATSGAMLVHYSTDYVFDGNATTPYRTDQKRDPLNAYGRSKAVGEEMLEASRAKWLCLRTSWLYAPWGKNFLRTIANAALTKPQLKVVNDQRGRPTSAEHLAKGTLAMIDRGAKGMHHLTDGGECTWCEFAQEIAEVLRDPGAAGSVATVLPCTSDEFPRPAKRPAYSVLDLAKTEALIGTMPHWKGNVRDTVRRREV